MNTSDDASHATGDAFRGSTGDAFRGDTDDASRRDTTVVDARGVGDAGHAGDVGSAGAVVALTGGSLGDVIAIDVGGTTMKCAVVGADGRARTLFRRPTGRELGPDAVVAALLDVAARLVADCPGTPDAVGVVVPGFVDEVPGIARYSANIGWRDVPLRALLRERLGLPVALGHDVRAGGLAEARAGGHRDALFVPLGTGVAAAHVVGGAAVTGAHGTAGELGHVIVRPGGPACGCGRNGCLEAIVGAPAVARAYTARTGEDLPVTEIAARTAAGEPDATTVWTGMIDALADGLLTAIALRDPEVVIIGGGLSEAGDTLFTPLRAALADRHGPLPLPPLLPATLGENAGVLGAAHLARDLGSGLASAG
ncbi:ROK family protein [Catenuloplanes sp. NPDC051500]|uniref:ROK family protein n=1 Tax=Catenuloplanes sp. NPDC051500 TaxID=3363959 RepID=UPI00378C218A